MSQQRQTHRPCVLCNHESGRVIFRKKGYNLVQCPSCGLVYVGNPPLKVELEKKYSFDSGYHSEYQNDHIEFKNELNAASKNYELIKKYKTQGRILDIGCSAGFFLKVAKENGWETYGVEISKDTAELARKRYGLKILTGALDENSFIPKFFDVVTMWDVIEHVENPIYTMSIINRILKDDGIIAIKTPNIDGLFPRLSYKISNLINYWQHPEPPGHLFQFSKKTVHKMLKLTGFTLIKIRDEQIRITYSFDDFSSLKRSSKRLLLRSAKYCLISSPKTFLYLAFFIPIALLGPIVHSGDSMSIIAKKGRACKAIKNAGYI